MALVKKKCPMCKKMSEQAKKGTNAKGKQRYQCKNCKGSWLDTPEGKKAAAERAKAAKKTSPKKTKPKKSTPKKTAKPKSTPKKTSAAGKIKKTVISVNGNKMSPKSGDLSVDDAFDMAKDSFLELKKKNHKVDIKGDTKHINFSISLGRKG